MGPNPSLRCTRRVQRACSLPAGPSIPPQLSPRAADFHEKSARRRSPPRERLQPHGPDRRSAPCPPAVSPHAGTCPQGVSSIHWGLVRPYDAYAEFGEQVAHLRDQHPATTLSPFLVVYKYIKNNTYISYHKYTHFQMWTRRLDVYIRRYAYICMCVCVWVHIWTCMCVPTYVSVCIYVCRSIRVCVCRSSHLIYMHILSTLILGSYLYIRMCVCVYVYMYIYACIYIYICIYVCARTHRYTQL